MAGDAAAASLPDISKFEPATEFFGFTPSSFVDDVINSVNEYLGRAMDSLHGYLARTRLPGSATDADLEKGTDQIRTMAEASLDLNFDRFELYALKNFFTIPPNVVLPHRQGLDTTKSAEDEIALDAQLATLRARLRAAQVVGSALEQERAWLRSRLELLTRAEQQLEFVQRLLREHGLAANGEEALNHVADAVASLRASVQQSVHLLQSEPYRSKADAAGPAAAGSWATLPEGSLGSLEDVKAFQAATAPTL